MTDDKIVSARELALKRAEAQVRLRLANNGRNAANDHRGIRVGSDLHIMEVLLAEIDRLRALLKDADASAREPPTPSSS